MRAMTCRGPGRVRIEEKPIPSIEHPNDAIAQVTCAALCGSDLHLYHGMMPDLRVGHTFGHEFVGTVHEVGSSRVDALESRVEALSQGRPDNPITETAGRQDSVAGRPASAPDPSRGYQRAVDAQRG